MVYFFWGSHRIRVWGVRDRSMANINIQSGDRIHNATYKCDINKSSPAGWKTLPTVSFGKCSEKINRTLTFSRGYFRFCERKKSRWGWDNGMTGWKIRRFFITFRYCNPCKNIGLRLWKEFVVWNGSRIILFARRFG